MALIAAAAIGALWHFAAQLSEVEPMVTLEIAAPAPDIVSLRSNGVFAVRDITIGMNAETVRRLYPEVAIMRQADGDLVASFTTDQVKHSLWFSNRPNGRIVRRIRITERGAPMGVPEIQARFTPLIGRPDMVDCWRGNAMSRNGLCRLEWLTPARTLVEVRHRVVIDEAGQLMTELTVTATDRSSLKRKTDRTAAGA